MFFNSLEFVYAFLPLCLAGYFLCGRASLGWALGWLTLASLVYYGWGHPVHLALILASSLANHRLGLWLGGAGRGAGGRALLILGLGLNLALLAYCKYTGFLLGSLEGLLGWRLDLPTLVMPLGISFFTFQQVAYLVDIWRGAAPEAGLRDYVLFVTFFPKVLAGPIVRHHELLPQLKHPGLARPSHQDLAQGLALFLMGLFKKVVMADGLAAQVQRVFDPAAQGSVPNLVLAWLAVLVYTLQIYFDFSGYSDMAVGVARMLGLRLPFNFDSPYKSQNIAEFWRRWHITLSRFLRDYLYVPLGGNRRGAARQYLNLLITMLLGGLWHGAGWTFILWGGLHGLFLVVYHAWRRLRPRPAGGPGRGSRLGAWTARLLTFACVALAWVFFRAADLGAALTVCKGLLALGDRALPDDLPSCLLALSWRLAVVWFLPNSQQIILGAVSLGQRPPEEGAPPPWWRWRPGPAWTLVMVLLATLALGRMVGGVREFLYYQF